MEGTVTISIKDFEWLRAQEEELYKVTKILEDANKNGEAVMTNELRQYIEEIYG